MRRLAEMTPANLQSECCALAVVTGSAMHLMLRALAWRHVERLLGHVEIARATFCRRSLVATIVIGHGRTGGDGTERKRSCGQQKCGSGKHRESPLSDGPLLLSGGDGTAIRKSNAGVKHCFPAELPQHDMSQPK